MLKPIFKHFWYISAVLVRKTALLLITNNDGRVVINDPRA